MGFTPRWINLIMMCVSTANYVVLINGCPTGQIFSTRGIRQGDSISPYMFHICTETLSSMLSWAERKGILLGVLMSKKGHRLNHLFFANDSLLFCRANLSHWHRLTKLLSTYEKASRHKLNKEKSLRLSFQVKCNPSGKGENLGGVRDPIHTMIYIWVCMHL